MSQFVEAVGTIVGVLDIIALFAWLIAAYQLFMRKREYQRLLGYVRTQQGGRPVALAVGIGGSIRGQVEWFLQDSGKSMQIIEIARDGVLRIEDYPKLLKEPTDRKAELTGAGVTELHVFFKGPVTLAAAMGAIFNNWVPTTIYNLCRDQSSGGISYCAEVILSRETTIGVAKPPHHLAPGI